MTKTFRQFVAEDTFKCPTRFGGCGHQWKAESANYCPKCQNRYIDAVGQGDWLPEDHRADHAAALDAADARKMGPPSCPQCQKPLQYDEVANPHRWRCVDCGKAWLFNAPALKEDEGAGAPANCSGMGNIAGLGVNKAGKPANWGEPSPRKKRLGETEKFEVKHPEPDADPDTPDELDNFVKVHGQQHKDLHNEAGSDFDYSNDIVTEMFSEGLLESTEPTDTFAGAAVFEVDMQKVHDSRFGKNRYHRYSKYVGEDEVGEQIRKHGRNRKSGDIILKDNRTAVMTYLRRKAPAQ